MDVAVKLARYPDRQEELTAHALPDSPPGFAIMPYVVLCQVAPDIAARVKHKPQPPRSAGPAVYRPRPPGRCCGL